MPQYFGSERKDRILQRILCKLTGDYMSNTKKQAFNYESERKQLCNQLSYKLRNPSITLDEKEKILKEFALWVSKIPT